MTPRFRRMMTIGVLAALVILAAVAAIVRAAG
jgi:hypothetical protein